MARRRHKEKIYRRRRPLRTLFRVLGITAVCVALLVVVLFFWLQRYIVHTQDGVRLDVPLLHGILDEIPEPAEDTPEPELEAEPEAPAEEPGLVDEPTPIVRAVSLSQRALDEIIDWDVTLDGMQIDRLLVTLNDATGQLKWASEVEKAERFLLEGDMGLDDKFGDVSFLIRRSAVLHGFHNQLLAQRNAELALTDGWLNPADPEVQTYLIGLALELGNNGFDEIVLLDFGFPPGHEGQDDEVILAFLRDLAHALDEIDVTLSILTRETDWYHPDGNVTALPPGLGALAEVVYRFYCLLEPDTELEEERFDALMTAAQAVLGEALYRFVPGGPGFGPEEGNWMTVLS